ncbi:MAG: hypothetical protein AAGA90_13520 [Actinomycetota bacterium]
MDYLVATYIVYTAAALTLTGVLARTLFRHGKVFLDRVFDEQEGLADAVNHLLVVGFYMLNLGYAFVIFRTNDADTVLAATEILVNNLGILLVSLGVIHFVNIAVFWKLRTRADKPDPTPPLNPTAIVPPPPAPGQTPYGATPATA